MVSRFNIFMCVLLGIFSIITVKEYAVAGISPPYGNESTSVLPNGVRNPRFRVIYTPIENKFDGEGVLQPLGKSLNQSVSWQDLLGAQATEADKNLMRSSLISAGLSEDKGGPGNVTGEVNTFASIFAPTFGIGVSNEFTLAVALPIYRIDVSADVGFVGSADGQKFVDYFCKSDPAMCNAVAKTFNNLGQEVNNKLQNYGYKPITSETVTAVGDMRVVTKYLAYNGEDTDVCMQFGLTLPTGKKPNADRVLDIPTGDGQVDASMGLVFDQALNRDFKWSASTNYTAQLPDTIEKRIPVAVNDPLSPDKEMVSRNLGDIFSVGTSLGYSMSDSLSMGCGYSYQYMAPTAYNGTLFTP